MGMTSPNEFRTVSGEITKQVAGLCRWFTNLPNKKRTEPMELWKEYKPEVYPKYDNYDAINVDKTHMIPKDYDGVMGVPISFLDKYCPTQFRIIGIANNVRYMGDFPCKTIINGKPVYNRLLIQPIR